MSGWPRRIRTGGLVTGGALVLASRLGFPSPGTRAGLVFGGVMVALTGLVVASCVRAAIGRRSLQAQVALLLLAQVVVLAALAIGVAYGPGVTGAANRHAQKRTMGDMRRLAEALEACAAARGAYPIFDGDAPALVSRLPVDPGDDPPPTRDAFSHAPLHVRSSARHYEIVSVAGDGRRDDPPHEPSGPTTDFGTDLVFADGVWVQFPDGTQR